MFYTYNKRQRLIRRSLRLLERVHLLSDDLKYYGLFDEYLTVVRHIERLFPVEIKNPHGHGI